MKNMYMIKQWDQSHTTKSKYLLSKFMQLVDSGEIITNRFPVTNGFVLLHQLVEVTDSAMRRYKNSHRVKSVLSEMIDRNSKVNIVDDLILSQVVPQISDWVKYWCKETIERNEVREINRAAKIFLIDVSKSYIQCIYDELKSIDYATSTNIERDLRKIDQLLHALVPQLLFDKHSLAFLELIPKKLKKKSIDRLIDRLFEFLNYPVPADEVSNRGQYRCFVADSVEKSLGDILNSVAETVSHKMFDSYYAPDSGDGSAFDVIGKDPYAAIRDSVTKAYRKLSLEDPKVDPRVLDKIWNSAYYLNTGRNRYVKYDFRRNTDPAIVNHRGNTLEHSLRQLGLTLSNFDSVIEKIEEPVYFYHLAMNAPSVENSYILLWTALEALMGLRTDNADIVDIKENVSKTIALGAVARRVVSFAKRFEFSKKHVHFIRKHHAEYNTPLVHSHSTEGIREWLLWLTKSIPDGGDLGKQGEVDGTEKAEGTETMKDPYELLWIDPLLCRQYLTFNQQLTKLDALHKLITRSKSNMDYQLDRLYFVRNTITHSGKSGHIGAYLWVHLEWYVGKLLAYSLTNLKQYSGSYSDDARDLVFSVSRSKYDSMTQYLKDRRTQDITRENCTSSGVGDVVLLGF